jgi:hypothetical protein
VAGTARAALFFLFEPASVEAGNVVTVRLGGTPASFSLADRRRPFGPPIRVYVFRNDAADEVRGRLDRRLHFVGTIVPDRNQRGVLTFQAPPLDSGTYVAAAWCPGCARYSSGRSFFTLAQPRASRYREQLALRLRLPRATADRCPVTIPRDRQGRYGNGLLATRLSRYGYLRVLRRDGVLFNKLPWLPLNGLRGELVVSGERLDAPGRMRVLGVSWGYASRGPAASGSWASAVVFPSEGCWRISARVSDVTLSYVARVVS